MSETEKAIRNDVIDEVLELWRIHPPSRIGEASFMRRLIQLKYEDTNDSDQKK